MKRIGLHLLLVTLVALVITSCEKEDLSFDETLLIGTWVSGTEFYKYKADGNGATWDESEDVKEEEALHFT